MGTPNPIQVHNQINNETVCTLEENLNSSRKQQHETSLMEIEMNKKQYSANDGLRAESMLMERKRELEEMLEKHLIGKKQLLQ